MCPCIVSALTSRVSGHIAWHEYRHRVSTRCQPSWPLCISLPPRQLGSRLLGLALPPRSARRDRSGLSRRLSRGQPRRPSRRLSRGQPRRPSRRLSRGQPRRPSRRLSRALLRRIRRRAGALSPASRRGTARPPSPLPVEGVLLVPPLVILAALPVLRVALLGPASRAAARLALGARGVARVFGR